MKFDLLRCCVAAALAMSATAASEQALNQEWLKAKTVLGDSTQCYYALLSGKNCADDTQSGVYLISRNWYTRHYGGTYAKTSLGCGTMVEQWGAKSYSHPTKFLGSTEDITFNGQVVATYVGAFDGGCHPSTTTAESTPKDETRPITTFPDTTPACSCPEILAPVCGTDGVTYGSACLAGCQGVKPAYEGKCRESTKESTTVATRPTDATKESTVVTKLSTTSPVTHQTKESTTVVDTTTPACSCPQIWAPVCGTDGVTYGSPCLAGCQRVKPAYDGKCKESTKESTTVAPVECDVGEQVDPATGRCAAVSCDAANACRDDQKCYGIKPACKEGTLCVMFSCADIETTTIATKESTNDRCKELCRAPACAAPPDGCRYFDPQWNADCQCTVGCGVLRSESGGECIPDSTKVTDQTKASTTPATKPTDAPTKPPVECGVGEQVDPATGNCAAVSCEAANACRDDQKCYGIKPACKEDTLCVLFSCTEGASTGAPCTCDEVWSPVCGKDGITYSNKCAAACIGQDRVTEGECGNGVECGPGEEFVASAGRCVETKRTTTLAPATTTKGRPTLTINGPGEGVDGERTTTGGPTIIVPTADEVAVLKAELAAKQAAMDALIAEVASYAADLEAASALANVTRAAADIAAYEKVRLVLEQQEAALATSKVNVEEQTAVVAAASAALAEKEEKDQVAAASGSNGSAGVAVAVVLSLLVLLAIVVFVVLHKRNETAQTRAIPSSMALNQMYDGGAPAASFENPQYDHVAPLAEIASTSVDYRVVEETGQVGNGKVFTQNAHGMSRADSIC